VSCYAVCILWLAVTPNPDITRMRHHGEPGIMQILEQFFSSGNEKCCGDLYLPDGVPNPPVLVMAHGFAGERSFRLPAFAEAFCRQGMAVFLFDYRSFGGSEGSPRQQVNPHHWRAAIAHVRALADIHGSRLALWGTSFSGGTPSSA
jgi:alpha-beta hydrolase superfamily lysophospholipase